MKKMVIFLSLITALLCLNISRSEADVVSLAWYDVKMTVSGQPVTPTYNGYNNYSYGDLTKYPSDHLIVVFNQNCLGGVTSLGAGGSIYTWPGNSSAWGVEDYYFRLIPNKPLPDIILARSVPLVITYFAGIYANSNNPTIFVEALMEIRPPGGAPPNQLFYLSNTEGGKTGANGDVKVPVKLGENWGIHLMGGGFVNLSPTAGSPSLGFNSLIDPTIVVDPESCFFIGTDKYFDKDLFSVEFSPNLAVPVPAALWLFGSGLLGLVGWRRFRKS